MFHRLRLKLSNLRIGLREKLLIPIVGTLTVSIIALSWALLGVQQRLTDGMRDQVHQTLQAADTAMGSDLEALKTDMGWLLDEMVVVSGAELSQATTKALKKQKFRIEYDWEAMMMAHGQSMAQLLASVSPPAVMASDRKRLTSYAKAVMQNRDVVYALFLRTDGSLLTRHLDRRHPKIKAYLKGSGSDHYNKVLSGAKQDASVMIVTKNIVHSGEVIGFVEMAIDKSGVEEKIEEMSERFAQMVTDNQSRVSSVLKQEAAKVRQRADTTVEQVIAGNRLAADSATEMLQQASATMMQRTRDVSLAGGIACITIVSGLLFWVVRRAVAPLRQALAMVRDIAQGEGDLTKRLRVSARDEVGALSHWFNGFLEKLQGIIGQIASTAGSLGSSSDALAGLSGQLSQGTRHMSGMSSTVATAAEKMSTTMTSVADSSDETATNVNMVAAAAEQMSGTISEIAMNSEKARAISETAVNEAREASHRMGRLDQAAQSIGQVTETIAEISDQTNLLALNATIEAARAGAVGKGFAVVANEIKELANQTAAATGQIRQQIEGIQGSASHTIVQIEKISDVIVNVNSLVGTIATAVEEQSITTEEIAGNVAQASLGIQGVNENVTRSSRVSGEIAKEIAGVNEISNQLSGNSEDVEQRADELYHFAHQLNQLVGKFKYADE